VIRSEARLVEFAMRHGGAVTLRELLGLGLARRDVGALVRRGRLLRPAAQVFVPAVLREVAGRDPRRRHLLSAAVALAVRGRPPELVISHASAALIHGLPVLGPPPATVELTGPSGFCGRIGRGVRLYEAELPGRFVCRVFGIAVSTPARTCVDLAREHGFPAGLVAADNALGADRCQALELADAAGHFRGTPFAEVTERVREAADGRSSSVLRSLSRAVLLDTDLPEPLFQSADPPVDFLWPRERVAGRTDEGDLARPDDDLRAAGYDVVRWGWAELRDGPDIVVTRIRAAFARTRRQGHWR
jgi:hypothetical protein